MLSSVSLAQSARRQGFSKICFLEGWVVAKSRTAVLLLLLLAIKLAGTSLPPKCSLMENVSALRWWRYRLLRYPPVPTELPRSSMSLTTSDYEEGDRQRRADHQVRHRLRHHDADAHHQPPDLRAGTRWFCRLRGQNQANAGYPWRLALWLPRRLPAAFRQSDGLVVMPQNQVKNRDSKIAHGK